ncbi:MAG: hypothetical protein JST09_22095 [Bacteroidetes bacterium]|nr:hypothetical protein [Bacteroidota bacterium]MBS1609288.1 hypothetical protein [Bacteroidota bacterium]
MKTITKIIIHIEFAVLIIDAFICNGKVPVRQNNKQVWFHSFNPAFRFENSAHLNM